MSTPSYNKNSMGKFILCLDTETTGSTFSSYSDTFSKYQAISFGAIVASADTFEPIDELYFEVKFDSAKYHWTEEAEKIHGISKQHLEQHGLSQEDAAIELAQFILKYFGNQKVAFLGHNPWFDISAMQQLLKPFNVMPELHHVVLDTSALGFITVGKFKSTELFELFNGERAEKHNALDDARMTLSVARSVRQIMSIALNEL